jgi:translation initiation factor 1
MSQSSPRIVYTTEGGAYCPDCGLRRDRCTCRPAARSTSPTERRRPASPSDGVVRLFRDSKRRRGKTVTVVEGVPPAAVDELAATLKRLCGAGGTVVDGAIEIQGDHRDRLRTKLTELGYRVKLAGG